MTSDIDCIFQGLGDRGAIYISSYKTAQNLSLLKNLKIQAVLSAARGGKIDYKNSCVNKYMYLTIDDTQSYDISQHFDQTYEFIENARKQTNVLIHCAVGISRSVTVAIAYLMKKYKYSLPQIYSILKRKRPKICPNPSFIKYLQEESKKYSVSSNYELENDKKKKYAHKRSFSQINTNKCKPTKQQFNLLQVAQPKQNSGKKQKQQKMLFNMDKSQIELNAVREKRLSIQSKIKEFRGTFFSKQKRQKNYQPYLQLTPKYQNFSLKSFPSKVLNPIKNYNEETIEQKSNTTRSKQIQSRWFKLKAMEAIQQKSKLLRKCSNPEYGPIYGSNSQNIDQFKKQSISSNETNDSNCIS